MWTGQLTRNQHYFYPDRHVSNSPVRKVQWYRVRWWIRRSRISLSDNGGVIVDDFLTSLATLPGSQTCESSPSFVATGGVAAVRRDGGSERVTASCFVFSPDFDRHDPQGGFSCNAHWDARLKRKASRRCEFLTPPRLLSRHSTTPILCRQSGCSRSCGSPRKPAFGHSPTDS